jgi:protoheme IX farnesyltransferase
MHINTSGSQAAAAAAALPVASSTHRPVAVSRSRTRLADYVELAKPRLNFLVIITTAVGYYLAVRQSFQWLNLLNTLLGTALTAAAAGALNQAIETAYDARMARTANRPCPARRISPTDASMFGAILAVAGVVYLYLAANPLTALLGIITLLSYIFIYTPLKRVTTLCTLVGAIPGAIPPVMGWTAVHNAVSPEALALFCILFLWQVPHFLAIAILYRDDYAAGSFKMLPVIDADLRFTGRQIILYTLSLVMASLVPAALQMAGAVYFTLAVILGLAFLYYAIQAATNRTRADARRLFLASILYLPLLLTAMMLNKL